MKGKYRRNIKKAERHGVTVSIHTHDASAVDAFYTVMQEIFKATDYVMHDKNYFLKVWEQLSQKDLARILLAEHHGAVVGAYLVALDEISVYELYGGVTSEGRDLEAGYMLKWEAMKMTSALGRRYYDHWGVAPRDLNGNYTKGHPLESISSFKHGFGGTDHCFAKTRVLVLNGTKYRMFGILSQLQKLKIRLKKLV
ncbi:MAG: FemAB family protein [candidate division WS6 bacterium OLB20]|uniref:FemAB family protein n=1 Tax=candidate division WS6 bacterium OLB20 TaxID=1617426 RepID=A0A136LZA4_9BACT|nr:MAG: FemAB family protein [candidate division WS6 bacterium OLB20]